MKAFSLGLLILSSVTAQAAFLPVCQRTEPVKKFLEQTLTKPCASITESDLLTVNRVTVAHTNISQFKVDDFSGLKNLEILNIRSNPFLTLPEGMFKDLGNLKTLVIIGNEIRYYPDDFLADTPLVENLHIFRTKVRSLSESIFRRLENLKNLQIIDIDDTLQTAEKERLSKLFPVGGRVTLTFE